MTDRLEQLDPRLEAVMPRLLREVRLFYFSMQGPVDGTNDESDNRSTG